MATLFTQQSTIYKRHEARRLANMEKTADPRPKVVRVLAGLPGFRNFLGEHPAPTVAMTTNFNTASSQTLSPAAAAAAAAVAAPAVFLSYNFAPDETVFSSY